MRPFFSVWPFYFQARDVVSRPWPLKGKRDGRPVRSPSLATAARELLPRHGSERSVGHVSAEVQLGPVLPGGVGILLAPVPHGPSPAAEGGRSGGPLPWRWARAVRRPRQSRGSAGN